MAQRCGQLFCREDCPSVEAFFACKLWSVWECVIIFCLQKGPWHACDTSKGFVEIENAGILNIEVHCIKGKLYKNEASN